MKIIRPFRLCGLLGAALCGVQLSAHAILVGPYAPDAFTLHLWHFDESSTPVVDYASTGGTNLTSLANGATLGTASFPGLGSALNTYDGGPNGTNAVDKDAVLSARPLANSTADNVLTAYADATTGAFTYEAVVRVDFDPLANYATVANGGNGRNGPFFLLGGEDEANSGRLFQFRLDPIGFDPDGAGSIPTLTQPSLEFINLNKGTSVQNIVVPIPTTGPDAIASNQWYHVALVYDGNQGQPNNLRFYWTRMDPTRTAANEIATATMNLDLATGVAHDLSIGNSGRNPANVNFVGLIDEVRLSSVARGPMGMMFGPANVLIDTQPASQLVAAGDTVTLLTVASGGAPLAYQWFFNNAGLADATNATLVLSNITPAQAGNYQVVVTNATSRATSAVAVVRVGGAFRELFHTGVGQSQMPLPGGAVDGHWQLIQSEDPAYPGPAMYVVSFPPGAWLANSGTSQWLSPGDGGNVLGGSYTFRTVFLLDTLDPANAQLNGSWISDNQGLDIRLNGMSLGLTNSGVLNSFTPFSITSGFVAGLNTLDFVVSNAPGTGPNPTGIRAELHGAALPLDAMALQLTSLPVNVSTQTQQSASFSVAAVGSGPLSYQWYHGAVLLAGQTNRTLVLAGLTAAEAGTYTVVVSNSLGSTNASAELTVITPPVLAWLGLNGSPDWDSGTLNWLNTGNSATVAFSPYADVLFDSRGNSAPMVNVVQPVNPNSITVDSTSDYTLTCWSGAGAITGSAPLVKKNSGTLILDVTNNSSGPVTILGGTVQVGTGGQNGTLGSGAVSNNGALVFNRSDALVVASAISGTGAVTNQGYGNTILLGNNSYSGPTVVTFGTLSPRHTAALGTTNMGTYVGNYGQLFLDVNLDLPGEPLELRGAGLLGDGALRKGGGGSSSLGGPITLAEDAMIKVDGSATLTLSNAASLTGANVNLTLAGDAGGQGTAAGAVRLGNGTVTKSGAGTWTLAGSNGTMSLATVSAGRLTLANGGALGNCTNVSVSPAATFALSDAAVGPASALMLTCDAGSALRSYLAAAAGTNLWAGPVSLASQAADGKGDVVFAVESANGALEVSSSISGSSLAGSLLLRGAGLGQLSGRVTLPNASVNKTDGSLWIISSTGNAWTNTTVASGVLRLGASQALPGNVLVRMGQAGSTGILDLAGFNQQIGGLLDNGGTEVIASSSTSADSLLTLQSPEAWGYSGVIQDSISNGTAKVALTLAGGGSLTLSNVNPYSGETTISAGTLALAQAGALPNSLAINLGSGATLDVTARTNGTLVLGPKQTLKGSGAFNVLGNLTSQGTMEFKVNKTGTATSHDSVQGLTQLTYGGTLKLVLSGAALSTSDSLKLFAASAYAGGFSNVVPATPGPGLAWNTNTLATDGTLRIATGVNPNPTNITAVLVAGGGTLQVSWPASHLGWSLQAQTNATSVGLSTNWFPVSGSAATNQVFLPLNPANGSVFYRLVLP